MSAVSTTAKPGYAVVVLGAQSVRLRRRFAIDFGLVANQKPVVHDGATYSCVKLVLRPEDGGKSASTWEVMARVQHPMTLPASYRRRSGKKAETACAAAALFSAVTLRAFWNSASLSFTTAM